MTWGRGFKITAGLGLMSDNVMAISRAGFVERQSARALALVSIAHARVSHV